MFLFYVSFLRGNRVTIFVGDQRLVVLVFALFERFGSVIGFDNTVFA